MAMEESDTGKKAVYRRIDKLYRSYRGFLVSCAMQTVGNREDAEDMVNDAFLKLLENPHRLKAVKSLYAYLYRCVRNNCLNFLEQKAVLRNFLETVNDCSGETQMLDDDNPLSVLISRETADNLEHAIDSLPPKCREIFIMASFEGKSYREIAEERGVTVNTVNTHIVRARRKILEITGKITTRNVK